MSELPERTTPPPVYLPGAGPAIPPPGMALTEKMALRTTAVRATKLYPGALGALVARELLAVEEFGWRFSNDSLIDRVRAQIDEEWRVASLT